MRTIIELGGEQVELLDTLCRREDISRAEGIRRAVAAYLERERPSTTPAFGLWRGKRGTGLEYEEARRQEWDRRAPAKRR